MLGNFPLFGQVAWATYYFTADGDHQGAAWGAVLMAGIDLATLGAGSEITEGFGVAARASTEAFEEASYVLPKTYQGGPGAMWTNEGRGLWELTTEGADEMMFHSKFGNFYKSSSDGLWWAVDNAGHGGSAFKVFTESSEGLQWFRDADQFGDFIIGKHKGPTGLLIPWNRLRGR